MKNRISALLLVTGLSAMSCCAQTWSLPEFVQNQTTTNAEANLKWSSQLYRKADIVLEYRGENWYERDKPVGFDGEPVFTTGTNALADAIPSTNECGRSLAVVVLPGDWQVCTNCETVEEVALHCRDILKAKAFRHVTVVTTHWAMWFEMFPNGWPSRAEIEKEKQEMYQWPELASSNHIKDVTLLKKKLQAEHIHCSQLFGNCWFSVEPKDFARARAAADRIISENSLSVDVQLGITNGSGVEVFENGKKTGERHF